MVETSCAAAQHRQRLVDVQSLRVTSDGCARGIRLLDEVVAVVGEDAGTGRGRLVNAPAKRVVREAINTKRQMPGPRI
jgi:hypothetical protein